MGVHHGGTISVSFVEILLEVSYLLAVATFDTGVRVGPVGPVVSVAWVGTGSSIERGKPLARSTIAMAIPGKGASLRGAPTVLMASISLSSGLGARVSSMAATGLVVPLCCWMTLKSRAASYTA